MRLENDQRTGDKTAQSPLEREATANQRNEVQPQLPGRWPMEAPRPLTATEPESAAAPPEEENQVSKVDPKQRLLW